MATKPAAKSAQTAIIEREPLTIAEVATILELSLTKLNRAIKDCPSDAVKKVLKTVAGNLSEISKPISSSPSGR